VWRGEGGSSAKSGSGYAVTIMKPAGGVAKT